MNQLTHQITRQLGINGTYKGYHYLVATLEIALNQKKTVSLFAKNIFPEVARMYNTTPECIERNIRTVIKQCWDSPYREVLQDISVLPLEKKPTVGEFIDILYWHIRFLEA